MQVTSISENLSQAINCLQEILNNDDGESIIQCIKDYKETKINDGLEKI